MPCSRCNAGQPIWQSSDHVPALVFPCLPHTRDPQQGARHPSVSNRVLHTFHMSRYLQLAKGNAAVTWRDAQLCHQANSRLQRRLPACSAIEHEFEPCNLAMPDKWPSDTTKMRGQLAPRAAARGHT